MTTVILFTSKLTTVERYSRIFMVIILSLLWSCTKHEDLADLEIKAQEVYVEWIQSNRITLNYKLSNLGYEETGVSYYKKSEPGKAIDVKAIRQDGVLKLSLENLEPNTAYVFNVFFTQNKVKKMDPKEHVFTTLSAEVAKFALRVINNVINYDQQGKFSAELEGENLQNLNLSDLDLRVNNSVVNIGYPVAMANNRYKVVITGTLNAENGNYVITGIYQGKQILLQSVPFAFDGARWWLSYKSTTLRGLTSSLFNGSLYYFFDSQVYKWSDSEQRLQPVGQIQSATIVGNTKGTEFDGQIFFPAFDKTYFPNPSDYSNFEYYSEAYSYVPGTDKWNSFSFKTDVTWKGQLRIENNNYFIHKNNLYLTYSVVNGTSADPNSPYVNKNYIFQYSKEHKTFTKKMELPAEIINYHLISMDNQLYLLGLIPLYDQGFKVSATLAVFKVSDEDFKLEEIYRGGTINQPITLLAKAVIVYDQKILIAASLYDFYLFDPVEKTLSNVYLKNNINQMYFGGLFYYNNKLHLNADLGFTSQRIYEISIAKSR